jgi:GR25 family glycosyltransferase involved in LPS biosynthesis
MKINKYFDNVIVINLDRRKDRIQKIALQLDSLNISYIRQSAIDAKTLNINPIIATRMSHIEAIKKYPGKTLILEDDALFCELFNEKFSDHIAHLPEDWDILFLGGIFKKPSEDIWNKNIFQSGLQAYCINPSKINYVIEKLENYQWHFDVGLASLGLNLYVNKYNLVTQYPSYSDIRLKNVKDF